MGSSHGYKGLLYIPRARARNQKLGSKRGFLFFFKLKLGLLSF